MIRRALVALTVLGLMLIGAPAIAAPPISETITEQNFVDTFVDLAPVCDNNAPYEITVTVNRVEHVTFFADGRAHFTFTDTGTFEAVPLNDPSLPSYTGSVTVWGGFNQNSTDPETNINGTFTLNARGTSSDGEAFKTQLTDHFNVQPDGTVHEFFRCR